MIEMPAYREGIYLTPVVPDEDNALHFHLLRCSTNLDGPTDNFRTMDQRIVNTLNREADTIFADPLPLNHVLAQIYWNTPASTTNEPNGNKKAVKAKIKQHADKTKDMPVHGIMAFCTFYDKMYKLQPMSEGDPFD